MAFMKLLKYCAAPLALATAVVAHGGTHQQPIKVADDANWATRHMAEEHHIGEFSPEAFFTLHDFNGDGIWSMAELANTYGFNCDESKSIPQESKDNSMKNLMRQFGKNPEDTITMVEWLEWVGNGHVLPDFGLGPGHHGDDEYEYEIHHWEKYHDENTREEDLIHPEDIAHFAKHDADEDEAWRVAQLDKLSIVDQNIPQKFRRN